MTAPASLIDQLGPPIKGPTALGGDLRRFFQLTWALAITDFKLRFFGSALGYVWQLMRPLMLFGVLYVVFSALDFGSGVKYYPAALLLGIVLFSFVNEATTGSVKSLALRENLVRKIEFPRLAVPLATVVTALFNLALNLVPALIFLLAAGARPRWSWLQLPLLVVALTLFVLGLSMLLSALYVRYRDIDPIWDVVMQVMFYATPIFYPIQRVLENPTYGWVGHAMMWNPFSAVLQQARNAVVDPSHLSAATAIGSPWLLLGPILLTLALLVAGYRVFSKQAPRIAEDL